MCICIYIYTHHPFMVILGLVYGSGFTHMSVGIEKMTSRHRRNHPATRCRSAAVPES